MAHHQAVEGSLVAIRRELLQEPGIREARDCAGVPEPSKVVHGWSESSTHHRQIPRAIVYRTLIIKGESRRIDSTFSPAPVRPAQNLVYRR